MHVFLYRIIFCISLFFIKDITACLAVKISDTLLENLLNASISIPVELAEKETPYSFWCKEIQQSYQGYQEEADKNAFNYIFSMCEAPGFTSLEANDTLPSILDYYQRSIPSWKNIDIPDQNQVTLFMHHIYLLDQFSSVAEKEKFEQFSTIYSTILRKWHNTLDELCEPEHANLNSYLLQGNKNLEKCCADLVKKVKKPLDMETIHNNLNTLINEVIIRKHITSFQKELFFWYGFQLLSLSSEKKEILDCVKEMYEKIKPRQEGETWQKEVFEYLLQVASIVETNIFFKDKKFSYRDSLQDSISADTLNYFAKSKDNFFLKKFIPKGHEFDAIVSFYASKVIVKANIASLQYLLDLVHKNNLQIVQQIGDSKYMLVGFGGKLHDYIISVGYSSGSNCDQDDLAMIDTIKNNTIVRLLTQNRHILSTLNYNNLLCGGAQHLLAHTDLHYDEHQKKYIKFQDQQVIEDTVIATQVIKQQKNSIKNNLEQNKVSFFTKKLLLGGIGISVAGLLGFLYYIQKNPEAYLSIYVQDIFHHARSLLT